MADVNIIGAQNATPIIEPDLDFIGEILASGGDSLKKCFQCGTCSVVCKLSPEKNTFPRREMIWTQWGLKDRVVRDPNVWLCHQCNDCSQYCPRGAKPGDVLAALRAQAIRYYAFPSFMAKALADPKFLPILVAFPVGLLLLVLHVTGKLLIPEGEVHYANMFSHLVLNLFFGGLFFVMLFILLSGVVRFWIDMDKANGHGFHPSNLIKAAIPALMDILLHKKFKECEANKSRYLAHLLVFYGFIGLLITTAIAVLYIVLMALPSHPEWIIYPLPWYRPEKFLGNASALSLFTGLTLMIVNRLRSGPSVSNTSYFDWLLIVVIGVLGATGVIVEILRYSNAVPVAYYVYFVHLVSVFMLLIYLPYSKFAHLVYRTVAMVYINYAAAMETPPSAGQRELEEAAQPAAVKG